MNFSNTFGKLLSFATGQAFNKGILGAVAGAVAGGAINKMFGGGSSGGKTSTQTQSTSANPFTSSGGLFDVSYQRQPPSPEAIALAQAQAMAPVTQRKSTSFGGGGGRNFFGANRGGRDAFSTGGGTSGGRLWDRIKGKKKGRTPQGPMGLNMSISDPTLQALNQLGLDQSGLFFNMAADSESAARAGELGLNFLNQLGETDPMEIAQSQFNLLNPILQQQQEQDFLDFEQRAFSQGRMGSTAGARDLNALTDAQTDAERKLLFDSLGQGMASQAQTANLAATMAQLDPAIRGAFQGIGQGFLNIPMELQNQMLRQAQVAGGLSGATNTGTLTTPSTSVNPMQAMGAGLLNSGIQGLTNSIPGLFQGSNTASFLGGTNPAYMPPGGGVYNSAAGGI